MNSNELPAGEFIRTLLSFQGKDEFRIPGNGLKDIIDAFEKSIKAGGGQILNFTTVKEIVVEDGQVRGVLAQKEGPIDVEAKIVISNAGPKKTIEMAGAKHFDKKYFNQVSNMKPTVGMDYLFTTDKPLLDFAGTLYTTDTRRKVSWSVPTMMWPEHSSVGKHLLHGFAVPESTLDYDPIKEQNLFMQDLTDVFPDFEQYGGELLLRRNFCGEWPCTRSWQGYDIEQETPVRNLYNVGDGVKAQGWIVGAGAAQSGRIVARRIIENDGR
jgi:phytoene dehydrogenase-like protein